MLYPIVAFHISFLVAVVLFLARGESLGPNVELSQNFGANARWGAPVAALIGLAALSGLWIEALRTPWTVVGVGTGQVAILVVCVLWPRDLVRISHQVRAQDVAQARGLPRRDSSRRLWPVTLSCRERRPKRRLRIPASRFAPMHLELVRNAG